MKVFSYYTISFLSRKNENGAEPSFECGDANVRCIWEDWNNHRNYCSLFCHTYCISQNTSVQSGKCIP